MKTEAILLVDMPELLAEAGTAPTTIQLVPSGKTIKARDGRIFRNSNPQKIVSDFEKDPIALAVDTDHEMEWKGGPAVGWIDKLEVKRGGSIWGHVDWNPQGAELIESRAYRYISPALFHDEAGEIQSISSVALVNKPALRLQALASHQGTQPEIETMNADLLKALGLDVGASENDAINRAAKLSKQASATPELDKWIPRADYNTALARAEAAEGAIKLQQERDKDVAITAAVDGACKDGKITPAQRDQAIAMCKAGGLEAFAEFVKASPAMVEPTRLDTQNPADQGTQLFGLSADELEVCKIMGHDPEEFVKFKKDEAKRLAMKGAA